MKILAFQFLLFVSFQFSAQNSRFVPKMAAIYDDGYYVTLKNDTIKGQIQVNPANETDFYSQFYFKGAGKSKPRQFLPTRIKAYGFSGRHFVMAVLDGKKQYVERLSTGRLRFFEYRYSGKVDGYEAIASDYYIKDTDAEGKSADLKVLKKVPIKFYKKALKPYMEDQPMIWSDLDKYKFDKRAVLSSIMEFNSFYEPCIN